MRHEVPWNEDIYFEFSRLAMLNPLEKEVLRMRIMGFSVTQTAMELSISDRTVNRIVKLLKEKYDQVQPYSDKLPKRKDAPIETWMDSH